MKRDELLSYLQTCVSENLTHARHVENERLTFTSIYVATTIGAVAAVFALSNRIIAAIVAFALFCFSLMAIRFNARWQRVFNDHRKMAERCQRMRIKLLKTEEHIHEHIVEDKTAFAASGEACGTCGNKPEQEQSVKQIEKIITQPIVEDDLKLEDKDESHLCGFGIVFDYPEEKKDSPLHHTSNLFKLLYQVIAGLMALLTLYLICRAIESPTGAGLYFSDSDRITLEAAINYFMEKLQVILK